LISLTKLIHGKGTISDAVKYRERDPYLVPSDYVRFTETRRPVVFWNVTNKCNLSCVHCYIDAGPSPLGNQLSLDEGKSFIADLAEMKIPLLMFTGGEPILRDDFWQLVHYAGSRGLKVALSTNGTLITKETAQRIKRLGLEYVGVSLDGVAEKTHDTFRNQPGSFVKAVQGVRNCVEAGLKCGIRMTAAKSNYRETIHLIDFATRLRVPRFCLYWLVPSGRGAQLYTKQKLEHEEAAWILDLLYKKAIESDPEEVEILTVDAPQDGIYVLTRLEKENPQEYENALKLLEFTGGACSAGDRVANVNPEGNIFPCQFAQLPELRIGNIREKKFSEIWNDRSNSVLSVFREKVNRLKGKCKECLYKSLCQGGCRIRAYVEYGDFWADDPFCPYNFKMSML